ncbi:MAG: glycosyltransferase family 2 protein [Tissierellia bacterium]|nr:glycosyltransferase family 2 protein [Tissierellia bacterium]
MVNYKSIDETIDYCMKELGKIQEDYVLVIVNNSSDEYSNSKISKTLDCTIIQCKESEIEQNVNCESNRFLLSFKENLGYAKGNNRGINFLIKNFPGIEYFLITNNDIKLLNKNIIDSLIKDLESDENIGMIGPKIIGIDGKDQSPHRKLSFNQLMIYPKLFYPFWLLLYKLKLIKTEVIENAENGYYYRIMGSFMILKKESFILSGGFDENTFLYAEELILSDRMRKKGYGTYFQPIVSILHNHGNVTKKTLEREKQMEIYNNSMIYYFRTYRNTSSLAIKLFHFSYYIYNKFYLKFR